MPLKYLPSRLEAQRRVNQLIGDRGIDLGILASVLLADLAESKLTANLYIRHFRPPSNVPERTD
jgi:hypothetical protein